MTFTVCNLAVVIVNVVAKPTIVLVLGLDPWPLRFMVNVGPIIIFDDFDQIMTDLMFVIG